MRRAGLAAGLALGLAVAVSAIAWPLYGGHAFVLSLEILAPLGVGTALLGDRIANHPGRVLGGLRRQLSALAVLGAAQLAVAVGLFAWLMFVSQHDAFFMALATGYAAIMALVTARLVASRALSDLDAVRHALSQVREGSRDVRVTVRGRDELARLAADVEAMVTKVAAEERARRGVVASVSHDLRTPVTTLQLIAEGLEDGIFEPEHAGEQLRLITTHVRALSALIDDLFELSRLEAGDVMWSMEHVRVDELVHEAIEAMSPHAKVSRVAVHAEMDADLVPARGNPERLQRVLFNLLQNAIRHTPADGSVVVRAYDAPGPTVEVEVADSGDGIEPDLRGRLFDPFVQGPSRVAGQTGSAGLGLAIARAIIDAHGGRIWLAETGAGTSIRFRLPAG